MAEAPARAPEMAASTATDGESRSPEGIERGHMDD